MGAGRKRRNRVVERVLTILLAVPLGLLVSAPSLVQPTEAAWQRTHMTGAQVTAVTIPPARLTKECAYVAGSVLYPARIEIYWTLPAGYDIGKADIQASTSGLGAVLPLTGFSLSQSTTFDTVAQHNVTAVPVGLLGLGTTLNLSIVMKEYGWSSRSVSVVATTPGILTLGGRCKNQP